MSRDEPLQPAAKVVDLSKERRKRDERLRLASSRHVAPMRVVVLGGAIDSSPDGIIRRGALSYFVTTTGEVVLRWELADGGHIESVLTMAQTQLVSQDMKRLLFTSRQVQYQARGAHRWLARPAKEAGRYIVSHDDAEVEFRPTMPRKPKSCTLCSRQIQAGGRAWVPDKDKAPRGDYRSWNWSRVVLCRHCVGRTVEKKPTPL